MATSIDDNEADEKSDKPRCQLINIRCTSTPFEQNLNLGAAEWSIRAFIVCRFRQTHLRTQGRI